MDTPRARYNLIRDVLARRVPDVVEQRAAWL